MSITTLEELIEYITQSTPPPAHTELLSNLKTIGLKSPIFLHFTTDNIDPLSILSPATHPVPVLFFLLARVNNYLATIPTHAQSTQLWAFILQYSVHADKDAVTATGFTTDYNLTLARQLLPLATKTGAFQQSSQALYHFIHSFYSPTTLTPLHPLLLQSSLICRNFLPLRTFLLYQIQDVDTASGLKYQDHLLFHSLGGTIMGLLGEWERASEMLEVCVSAPGTGVSLIQIDAYKRLLLSQLLAYGTTKPLPSYTSPTVLSSAKSHSTIYTDLCAAFTSRQPHKLESIFANCRDQFEKDQNLGLIHLCLASLTKRIIQKLTTTYLTISLREIMEQLGSLVPGGEEENRLGLERLKLEIELLIASKDIQGTITPQAVLSETTITFTSTSTKNLQAYKDHKTVNTLTRAIVESQFLEKKLQWDQNQLEASKDFVTKVCFPLHSPRFSLIDCSPQTHRPTT